MSGSPHPVTEFPRVVVCEEDGTPITDFGGVGGGGDASAANQTTEIGLLTTIDGDTGAISVAVLAEGATNATPSGIVPFWRDSADDTVYGTSDDNPLPVRDSVLAGLATDETVRVSGWHFDLAVTPTVTAGAYSAGDIMGGLLTFTNAAEENDMGVIITGAQVSFKVAVMPNPLTLIVFSADPTATTQTDNAAYSLNAADAFKVVATIPFQTLGVVHTDHGTPNTIRIDNLGIVTSPISGTRNFHGLLIDGSGVTLGSTSDVQIRFRGVGA